MVESSSETIVLGFLTQPQNSLILTSKFLPNKVGGLPAWISDNNKPPERCEHCGYKLSFLMQLYSNLDREDPDLHRMLYVFTCVSPACISTQRAVRVYRGYAQDDPKLFASDSLYDKVFNASSDDELIKMKLLPPQEEVKKEEEVEDDGDDVIDVDIKEVGLEFDEWVIETDIEPSKVTKVYLKESAKLKSGTQEDEEDDDEVESAFVENAMGGADKQRVEKILKGLDK